MIHRQKRMSDRFKSACPIMPSVDFDKTIAFYAALGFEVMGVYPDAGFLLLERDQVELHSFHDTDHDPSTCDHGVYLRVANAPCIRGGGAEMPWLHERRCA